MATQTKKPAQQAVQPETSEAVVIKELPLEKVIDQTLAKSNVTQKVLTALKNKYLVPDTIKTDEPKLKEEFVLKNPTDKETYLMVVAERKSVRKVGILTEDLCKKGRADAIKVQAMWLDKQKEILGEVATVQDQLDEQIKIFEDEEKRLEEEENKRKDEQFNVRQTQLIKMGAVLANGCLNLNQTSIETTLIREADEETYNETILPLFQIQYEKNEAARIAKEKEDQRQKEELEKQQQELRQQQELLQKQKQEHEDAIKKQQEELRQQKEQFEKQQKELRQQKINNRCLQLEALGMKFSFQHNAYTFEDVNIDNSTELCLWDDATWETKLQEIKPVIEQRKADKILKQQRQEKRSAQLSELGMTFTGTAYKFEDINIPATDLTGMDDNTWAELIATTSPMIDDRKLKAKQKQEEQWKQQQEQQQKQLEQQRQEELAKASDKEKWANFVDALNQFSIEHMPEFKSSIYKNKRQIAKEKLEEIASL